MATLLKAILHQRHIQTYELFRDEFHRVARQLDSSEEAPSRTQYRRWLGGDLKKLPHARHCRILAEMFPDWSVDDLFGPADEDKVSRAIVSNGESSQRLEETPGSAIERPRVVDVHTEIWLDVDADGRAVVRYAYEILNLTERPIGRVPRTVWFKHTHDEISVEPIQYGDQQIRIEILHESEPQKKFAYRVSPAIEVGGRAKYGCEIRGGLFTDELYWRHAALRDTDLMTMEIVHRGHTLTRSAATEELTDGSEILVSDDIEWRQDGPDLRLRLQSRDLEPTQVVTLRWEVDE